MGVVERDSTDEWRLPPEDLPPTVTELVGRIDEALATARASEAAVMTVGAAALDAAEQARRAAELAERASEAIVTGRGGSAQPQPVEPGGGGLDDFDARADRLAERLSRLQRLPLAAPASAPGSSLP